MPFASFAFGVLFCALIVCAASIDLSDYGYGGSAFDSGSAPSALGTSYSISNSLNSPYGNTTTTTPTTEAPYVSNATTTNIADIVAGAVNMTKLPLHDLSLKNTLEFYISYVVANSQQIAADLEAQDTILSSLVERFKQISLHSLKLSEKVTDISVVVKTDTDPGYGDSRDILFGLSVVDGRNIKVRQICLVIDAMRSAYVVYKEDTSPQRPLPVVTNMLRHQALDVFRIPGQYDKAVKCQLGDGFETVVMQFRPPAEVRPNARRGCVVWDEVKGDWASEDCFIFSDTNSWATCHCDVQRVAPTAEKRLHFLVYSYLDFAGDVIKYMDSISPGVQFNTAGKHIDKYIGNIVDLAATKITSASIEILLQNLFSVFGFVEEVYTNVNSVALLENVGKILENTVPSEDVGVLGRGTGVLTSFAVSLNPSQRDSMVGFSFYEDKDMWMEYQKSSEFDKNRLFGKKIAFAFYFSPSVPNQNSRYAFLLYPDNAYFHVVSKLPAVREIVSSRVIDIVLTPNTMPGKKEELITFFYKGQGRKYHAKLACAGWHDAEHAWNETFCSISPGMRRPECTCNLSLINQTRVQVAVYEYTLNEYQEVDIMNGRNGDLEMCDKAIFVLKMFTKNTPTNPVAFKPAVDMLSRILATNKSPDVVLDEEVVKKVASSVRSTLAHCRPAQNTSDVVYFSEGATAACFLYDSDDRDKHGVAFADYRGSQAMSYNWADYIAVTIDSTTWLVVHVSNSVVDSNLKFAAVVYPQDSYPRTLPVMPVRRTIVFYRVVDVVLVPNAKVKDDQEQFMNVYIDMYTYNTSIACAAWVEEEGGGWTENGTSVGDIRGDRVCNFSLTATGAAARGGGQFLVYGYVDAVVDEKVYAELKKIDNEDDILSGALAWFSNSSRLVQTSDTMASNMRVLDAVVSIDQDDLVEQSKIVNEILGYLQIMFRNYLVDRQIQVSRAIGFATKSYLADSNNIKYLYSNYFEDTDRRQVSSMYVIALGYYGYGTAGMLGFYFQRDPNKVVSFSNEYEIREIENYDPNLGVFFRGTDGFIITRFIFVVYPTNKLMFPSNMVDSAIFNVRQIDFYSGKDDWNHIPQHVSSDVVVNIYFSPTANPNWYLKTMCSVWDDSANGWIGDDTPCYMIAKEGQELCQCNLMNREVTRVVVYEYANLENFIAKKVYSTNSYVFIGSAFMSLIGLTLIFVTAIFFRNWRQSLGNKIFLNLTLSTSIYLMFGMTVETHHIFAIPQYNNKQLIAYNFCMHYSRLAHYNWMFVVSILQWKGESWTGLPRPDSTYLLLKLMAAAWLLPLVPLCALLTWNVKIHFLAPHRLTHYLLFIAPGGLIGVVNLVMLIAISIRMWRYWYAERKNYPQSAMSNRKMMVLQVKSISKMFFLFGIPTVFEVFNDIGDGSPVVEFLFKLTDPLQGLMLCVFFICFDRNTRKLWVESKIMQDAREEDEDIDASQYDSVSYIVGNESVISEAITPEE